MKLMSRASTLSKIREETKEYSKIYSNNPYPIKGDVGHNIVKLFSSAMNELELADRNISECSSIAQYIARKVKYSDRQKFVDALERAIWEIDAFDNNRIKKLSNLAGKIKKSTTLKDIADAVVDEISQPVRVKEKIRIND